MTSYFVTKILSIYIMYILQIISKFYHQVVLRHKNWNLGYELIFIHKSQPWLLLNKFKVSTCLISLFYIAWCELTWFIDLRIWYTLKVWVCHLPVRVCKKNDQNFEDYRCEMTWFYSRQKNQETISTSDKHLKLRKKQNKKIIKPETCIVHIWDIR